MLERNVKETIRLENFAVTGNLFEVGNAVKNGSFYFYFSPDNIDSFYKLNENIQAKFLRLTHGGCVNFAAAQNDQGLKFLGNKKNLPKCTLQINDNAFDSQICYELKIAGTDDRIGVVPLKLNQDGTEILIATHAIKGGFHSNKHNGKHLKSKPFVIGETTATNKQGFFNSKKQESHHENNSCPNLMKK